MRFATCLALMLAQLPEFPPTRGTYQVYVTRVVDGDTVEFYWLVKGHGRLAGINAPEMSTEDGPKSKQALEALLPPSFYVADFTGKEKYGRTLVDIHVNGSTASKLQVLSGNAKNWDGKGARP